MDITKTKARLKPISIDQSDLIALCQRLLGDPTTTTLTKEQAKKILSEVKPCT